LIKISSNHLIKLSRYAYNVNKVPVIIKVSNLLPRKENFGSELNQVAKSYFINRDKTEVLKGKKAV
jgi:hypothetical protein